MTLVAFSILAALVALAVWTLHRRFEDSMSRIRRVSSGERVPGPRGIFLLLQTLKVTLSASKRNIVIATIDELQPQYGGTFGAYFAGMPTLFVSDPETAKSVLRDEEKFARLRPKSAFFDMLSSKSVGDSVGQEWSRQRHLMSPAFHFEELQSMMPTFVEKAVELVEVLRQQLSSSTEARNGIEVVPLMSRVTLDVIGAVAFGHDFTSLKETAHHKHPMKIAYETYTKEINNPLRFVDFYNRLRTKHNMRIEGCVRAFDDYILEIIAQKRARQSTVHESQQQQQQQQHRARHDVMDLLIRANDSGTFTDRELLDNAKLFYLAGHETSSSTLSWTLGALAQNPSMQRKLYEEVQSRLGDRTPTAESVKEMSFLHNCIKESMRLYSPVISLLRTTTEDAEVEGYFVPKGCLVQILVRSICLNPEFWESPLRFDPDRFTKRPVHPFAYLPFGLGPRVCIGQHLAMMEMRVILAALVQSFEFKEVPDSPMRNSSHFLLQPTLDYKIQFVPRN